MRFSLVSLGLAAALLASACGGGDNKGYGDPIAISSQQKTQIGGLVTSAASVSALATSPCDGNDLAQMAGLYQSMTLLLDVKLAAKNTSGLAAIGDALRAAAERSPGKRPASGTCLPGTGSVTFDNYEFDGGTINGSLSFSNGTYSSNLTVTLTSGDSTIAMTMKGTLMISSSSLTGNLTVTASASVQGATVTAEFASSFDLQLTNDCATGGQIEVHASGEATSTSVHSSYDVWTKAVFGPACGDVTIY